MDNTNKQDGCKEFIEFLTSKGYKRKSLYVSNYRYPSNEQEPWFKRVEVRDKGKIVQAFIIMPEEKLKGRKKYPFHRVYKQYANSEVNITPVCYVVTPVANNTWDLYNSNCLDYKMDEYSYNLIINYKEAKRSFYRRWNSVRTVKMVKELKIISAALVLIGVVLMIFHNRLGITSGELMTTGILTSLFAMVFAVAPCLNSIKIFGTGICLSKEDE